ncbi:MAG: hypothetical protein L5656_11325 [Thermanaeromonas sp.]|uniref:hypothetical protein n=1 Tax=Thermanaeromonas sp. TaxID=2003697 RepID=UPI00243EE442|nr:hypothetical protein [Thermanaeromonas sp.]MCG0279092.1 hypothetical protein [Thermanaeromonas sp.]
MTLSIQDLYGHGWSLWSCWRPRAGYKVGGDFCYMFLGEKSLVTAVVDVLGHGEEAYRCALELFNVMNKHEENLETLFTMLEATAARYRGCALFLGALSDSLIKYIMVGNMRAWVLQEPGKIDLLYAQPGVVGGRRLNPVTREVKLAGTCALIVCSDGIRRSFVPPKDYLSLTYDGMEIVGKILEKYGIHEDDASILVGRRCR